LFVPQNILVTSTTGANGTAVLSLFRRISWSLAPLVQTVLLYFVPQNILVTSTTVANGTAVLCLFCRISWSLAALDIPQVAVAFRSCYNNTIQALEVTRVDQGDLDWLIPRWLLLMLIVADYFSAQYENRTGHVFL